MKTPFRLQAKEMRLHTQNSPRQHTVVKGKVEKSITGKGASVVFYSLEDHVVDPTLARLNDSPSRPRPGFVKTLRSKFAGGGGGGSGSGSGSSHSLSASNANP